MIIQSHPDDSFSGKWYIIYSNIAISRVRTSKEVGVDFKPRLDIPFGVILLLPSPSEMEEGIGE